LAWLHASPKKHDKEKNPKPRFKTLPDDHQSRQLPEIDEYLALCFELSGFSMSGSMGAVPLTWSELDSFICRSGYKLSGFESEMMIRMSRAYCVMLSKASENGCPAPYQDIDIEDEDELEKMRERVSKQWGSFSNELKPIKKKTVKRASK
jgi:hypothetical protein